MSTMSRSVLVSTVSAVLVVLAGICAQPSRAWAADLLDTIRKQGTLTIGTSNDAPLSYIDSQTNEAAGALSDVLVEFLKRQKIDAKLKVVAMPFASLIPSIQSGRIELIGDAMYVRPQRKEVIDFTDVTFYNPESLDVPKGNPKKLHKLADLCGHSAGSYEGTTYIDLLKAASGKCPAGSSIDIKQYPTILNVFADLSAARIDAAVVDSTLSAYALTQNPSLQFELVGDYHPEDKDTSNCAFGLAKGNEGFLKTFNTTYAEMKKDGTVARIFEHWGLVPTDFFLNP